MLKYLFTFAFISATQCTIDINFSEYQHLADHLTERECRELVTALHFPEYRMPEKLNAAERRLPQDVPCIDLLLHWNSKPGEGKGQTHVQVCHRLNQIGRQDLAKWLSKTVFHQLSKDLKIVINESLTEKINDSNIMTEVYIDNQLEDEAPWLKIDTVLSILLVVGLVTLIVGILYFLALKLTYNPSQHSYDYKKLNTCAND